MGYAKAPAGGPVEVQLRGFPKVLNNSDCIALDSKIPLSGAGDSEEVFFVLVYAVGFDLASALIVGGHDAELEFLEVLVAVDTSDKDVIVGLLGNETVEREAQQLEGLVLLDANLGYALI